MSEESAENRAVESRTSPEGGQPEAVQIPSELPILPMRGAVIFPHTVLPISVGREKSMKLVDESVVKEKIIGAVTQRRSEDDDPGPDDLYEIGTAVQILKMMKTPDGPIHMLAQGLGRVRITGYSSTDPYLIARVEPLPEKKPEDQIQLGALAMTLKSGFRRMSELNQQIPPDAVMMILNLEDPVKLGYLLVSGLTLSLEERMALLTEPDLLKQLNQIHVLLNREIQTLEIGSKIQNEVQKEVTELQREHILREQLKAIQKELGEKDDRSVEADELAKRIADAKMPEEAEKVARKELDRLKMMPPQAAEYTVSRTYLDWLVDLPWSVMTEDNLDVARAREILNEDHHDLEKVKRRILEYLSVRKLKPDAKGPILCFFGPPGTGKTSLGRSIARALGRKFVRISLGGVRDEAEIRGHRRTYVGALPGRIIQGLKKAGTRNPVFMLDEIDKLGMDFRGDPSSALLEVLDPEQNFSFSDHYVEVPFDLTRVMFITTANVLDTIPPALRDRMEVLELPGYTQEEKVEIARQFLIPRQLEAHGLKPDGLTISDETIERVIRDYTREAGLRNLERELAGIIRSVARELAEGRTDPRHIGPDDIAGILGPIRFFSEVAERMNAPGVATGLAWTPAGGDVLFIEATRMPGRKSLVLTGSLGDVMKESAQAALSYIRSQTKSLGIPSHFFETSDIHLHIPAGAVPKDGPSAGVTMAAALASLLTGRPVRADTAMTGEITLRGKVLPVGGIKDKVLAARRAGLRRVLLPRLNEKDLIDVPENARAGLQFTFVDTVDDVFKNALLNGKPVGSRRREGKARRSPKIRAQKPARAGKGNVRETPAAGRQKPHGRG